jgi:hypothetical protein
VGNIAFAPGVYNEVAFDEIPPINPRINLTRNNKASLLFFGAQDHADIRNWIIGLIYRGLGSVGIIISSPNL